jgi:hypothetical protein
VVELEKALEELAAGGALGEFEQLAGGADGSSGSAGVAEGQERRSENNDGDKDPRKRFSDLGVLLEFFEDVYSYGWLKVGESIVSSIGGVPHYGTCVGGGRGTCDSVDLNG